MQVHHYLLDMARWADNVRNPTFCAFTLNTRIMLNNCSVLQDPWEFFISLSMIMAPIVSVFLGHNDMPMGGCARYLTGISALS